MQAGTAKRQEVVARLPEAYMESSWAAVPLGAVGSSCQKLYLLLLCWRLYWRLCWRSRSCYCTQTEHDVKALGQCSAAGVVQALGSNQEQGRWQRQLHHSNANNGLGVRLCAAQQQIAYCTQFTHCITSHSPPRDTFCKCLQMKIHFEGSAAVHTSQLLNVLSTLSRLELFVKLYGSRT